MNNYKIGLTQYDDDKMLWGTDLGKDNKVLIATVWDKTKETSISAAEQLAAMFNKIDSIKL